MPSMRVWHKACLWTRGRTTAGPVPTSWYPGRSGGDITLWSCRTPFDLHIRHTRNVFIGTVWFTEMQSLRLLPLFFSETTCVPQNVVTVPLLIPLITLLERQAVVFDGMDVWENTDQSCEIMLKHLGTARLIAQNANTYSTNAERILAGRKFCGSLALL